MQRQREYQSTMMETSNKRFKANVSLPSRREITQMSLENYELRLKEVESIRNLTPDELYDVKKVRHMIKNKLYARESRIKKKERLAELENQVGDLQDEVIVMQQALHAAKVEIFMLKSENLKLRSGEGEKTPLLCHTDYKTSEMIWDSETSENLPPLLYEEFCSV